jgi:tetratricopeptide (TPR) repeat protein
LKRLSHMSAWPGLTACSSRRHQSTICLVAAVLAIAGVLHVPVAAQAEGTADSPAEAAPAADPRQLCLGPATSPDERVKACSAVIESGQTQGSLLAAAYAQRGFIFTLRRNLEQAQKDLDQAVKIAPDYAEALYQPRQFLDRLQAAGARHRRRRARDQARAESAACLFRPRRRRSQSRSIRQGDRRL